MSRASRFRKATDKLIEEMAAMPEEIRKGMVESWGKVEHLDPELEPYIQEDDGIGSHTVSIKHPLVFSILHLPQLNHHINSGLAQKSAHLEELESEEKWSAAIFLHERPYRFNAFEQYSIYMSDEEYWDILGEVWIDSENIWQNQDGWTLLFQSSRPGKREIMTKEEKRHYERLAPEIKVYRGYAVDEAAEGLSWTLSKARAEWFAQRFAFGDRKPRLIEGRLDKFNVVAVFDRRSEAEIVVSDPFWIRNRKERVL